ncbi:hypothetical protein QR680_006414 [Steinernema hermaphroditum]|uniref:Uncharacterized protein n=1 Tax=Steinernema hermaphroditum TaxID=289476 RepID=A0AA39HXR0_9BILA|nr:hypothetical protein QR680_006414 [Steinernema hermaphroditum]
MVAERAALRDEEHEAQIRKTSKTLSSDRASTKSSASVTQSVKEVFETVLEKASARQENRFQNELKMPPTEVAIASKTTESPTTNRETERESESGAVVSADRNESVASWGDDSDDDCLTEDGEQYDNEPPEPKPFIVRRD